MKIKKITENKIQIIIKQEDLTSRSINIQNLLLTTPESQKLFLEILNQAKEEVNFDTEGHKLLIEAFFENTDAVIFTITKYIDSKNSINLNPKRYLTVKRKNHTLNTSYYIYNFNEFEDFCNFCNCINKNISTKGLYKSAILYYYNNQYYLIIDGINKCHKFLNAFHSYILEFAKPTSFTKNFKFKLAEHGKIVIKNNAINTGIKYFS